jgi:hypothetical protein
MFEVMGQEKRGGLGKHELELKLKLALGAQAQHRTGRSGAMDWLAGLE